MTPPERIAALAPDPRRLDSKPQEPRERVDETSRQTGGRTSLAAAVCWSDLMNSITRVTPKCDTAV